MISLGFLLLLFRGQPPLIIVSPTTVSLIRIRFFFSHRSLSSLPRLGISTRFGSPVLMGSRARILRRSGRIPNIRVLILLCFLVSGTWPSEYLSISIIVISIFLRDVVDIDSHLFHFMVLERSEASKMTHHPIDTTWLIIKVWRRLTHFLLKTWCIIEAI